MWTLRLKALISVKGDEEDTRFYFGGSEIIIAGTLLRKSFLQKLSEIVYFL